MNKNADGLEFVPGQRVRNRFLVGDYKAFVVGYDPTAPDFVVVAFADSYIGWHKDAVRPHLEKQQ